LDICGYDTPEDVVKTTKATKAKEKTEAIKSSRDGLGTGTDGAKHTWHHEHVFYCVTGIIFCRAAPLAAVGLMLATGTERGQRQRSNRSEGEGVRCYLHGFWCWNWSFWNGMDGLASFFVASTLGPCADDASWPRAG